MHKVDAYLLKNSIYILVLANLVALFLYKWNLFLHLTLLALLLNLVVFILIKLTIHRYARKFGKTREQIKNLLGRYIEEDSKEKRSFHDYIKNHQEAFPARYPANAPSASHKE
jgi:ABC-type bacteriocin/lantibiotic exporter with double-glycine peptidase domain